jgi:hypothetical protein
VDHLKMVLQRLREH